VSIDPKGNAWYTGNRNGMIGCIDERTDAITRPPMPDSAARDPHTIAFDARGDLWFTLQDSNMVGHLTHATGTVMIKTMTTPRSRPYGIVLDYAMTVDDEDRLRFVETGLQPNRLVGCHPPVKQFFRARILGQQRRIRCGTWCLTRRRAASGLVVIAARSGARSGINQNA
jgi:streptogramin lyase